MKLSLYCGILLLFTAFARGVERPTGGGTPEGIACDAIQAYADCDSKAWLATLVRPIYGEKADAEYEKFKKDLAATTDANKTDKEFAAPKIVKVYKARNFTKNGPGSMAYALFDMTGNMLVDIVVEIGGKKQQIRYHVLLDKDKKWYFEPRPDLSPLLAMGLNDESPSKDVCWEAAKAPAAKGKSAGATQPAAQANDKAPAKGKAPAAKSKDASR